MEILRTRFKKDIVSEFLPPAKPSPKVIILCMGMPTTPFKDETMEFFSEKGYWVFFPRYRGTWESSGEFLKDSPNKDINDVIEGFSLGFKNSDSGEEYKIESPEVFVLGSSFGGPAAIFATAHPAVKRAVAISPVIDWTDPSELEPMDKVRDYTREAFGEAYRFSDENWEKLARGGFYDPISNAEEVKGEKLLLIHTKDDKVVDYQPTEKFSKVTGAKFILLEEGGHMGFSEVLSIKKTLKEILKHLS